MIKIQGNDGFFISFRTAQQVTMDRKGLAIFVDFVHRQEFRSSDDMDYIENLNKFTPTIEYAWIGEDYSGDPISYDPQLDPELKTYLRW